MNVWYWRGARVLCGSETENTSTQTYKYFIMCLRFLLLYLFSSYSAEREKKTQSSFAWTYKLQIFPVPRLFHHPCILFLRAFYQIDHFCCHNIAKKINNIEKKAHTHTKRCHFKEQRRLKCCFLHEFTRSFVSYPPDSFKQFFLSHKAQGTHLRPLISKRVKALHTKELNETENGRCH